MIFSGLDFDFGKRWCDPAKTLFANRWSVTVAWQPTWGGTYNNARDRSTAQAYVSFQF